MPIFNKKIKTSKKLNEYFKNYDFTTKIHILNGFFKDIMGGKLDSWGYKATKMINELFRHSLKDFKELNALLFETLKEIGLDTMLVNEVV